MFSSFLSAQTYSGKVTDACTGQPLAGITIFLSGNIVPGNTSTVTNASGNWQKNVTQYSGATSWTIIPGGGVSNPGSTTIQDNNQNVNNINFNLLRDDWNFAFDVNGTPLNFYASPPYQTTPGAPLEVCTTDDVCIGLSSQYLGTVDGEGNECYTFRMSVFTTDATGVPIKFVGDECINVDGFNASSPSACGDNHFDFTAIIEGSELVAPNEPLYVQIDQFCCSKKCETPRGGLVNREHFYMSINGLTANDVSFDFSTSQMVDPLNTSDPNEPSQTDGREPTSNTVPGPTLGPISVGAYATVNLGLAFPLDLITYTINDVNCMTGDNIGELFSYSIPLSGSSQPSLVQFFDLFQYFDPPPPGGGVVMEPWFSFDRNTMPNGISKCFEMVVTVYNECGEISTSGFFQIEESCTFCDPNDPNDPNDGIEERSNVGENAALNSDVQFETNVSVFPNPAKDKIFFNLDQPLVVQIRLMDISGKTLDSFSIGQSQSYDISQLAPGTYFYEWQSGKSRKVGKIIKL